MLVCGRGYSGLSHPIGKDRIHQYPGVCMKGPVVESDVTQVKSG